MSLSLIVDRGKDYVAGSSFTYTFIDSAELEQLAVERDRRYVSAFDVPDYLEDKARELVGVRLYEANTMGWDDHDLDSYAVEFKMFNPLKGNEEFIGTGIGSFILSMTFAALYEDAQRVETPFNAGDEVYGKNFDTDAMRDLLKRRGFHEDPHGDAPDDALLTSIRGAYEKSKERERAKR